MSPEKEKILVQRYPKTFVDIGGDPSVTCMAWGLECGDDWFFAIDAFLDSVHNAGWGSWYSVEKDDPNDKEARFKIETMKDFWVIAQQVKSKFGGLRFYYGIGTSEAFQEQAKKWPKTAESIIREYQNRVEGALHMCEQMCYRLEDPQS